MLDPLHLFLVGATVGLLIQASRRTMGGLITLVAIMCLVLAVVILSVRNKSLKTSLEEERNLSLKSMEATGAELDACREDDKKKEVTITDLESRFRMLDKEKTKIQREVDELKSEVADKANLANTIEHLNAEVASLREKSGKQLHDVETVQKQVTSLNVENSALQAKLDDALQKLAAAQKAPEPAAAAQKAPEPAAAAQKAPEPAAAAPAPDLPAMVVPAPVVAVPAPVVAAPAPVIAAPA